MLPGDVPGAELEREAAESAGAFSCHSHGVMLVAPSCCLVAGSWCHPVTASCCHVGCCYCAAAIARGRARCKEDDPKRQQADQKAVEQALQTFDEILNHVQRSIRLGKAAFEKGQKALQDGYENKAFLFMLNLHRRECGVLLWLFCCQRHVLRCGPAFAELLRAAGAADADAADRERHQDHAEGRARARARDPMEEDAGPCVACCHVFRCGPRSVLHKIIAASFCTRLCEFRVVAPVSSCRMLFVWHVSGCGALQLARPGEEPGTSAVPDSPASEPVETANKKIHKTLGLYIFPRAFGQEFAEP